MAIRSRSLWKGLSTNKSVRARTTGYYKAYIWLSSKPDKRHILGYSSQHLFLSSANSISGRLTLLFCQCQKVLPENHYDNNLSPWSEWSLGHMGVLDTVVLPQHLSSPLKGLQLLWEALLPRHFLAARRGVISCLQYWQCKGCHKLCCFGGSLRTGTTVERQSFRIWGPGREGRVDLSRPKE